MFNNVDFLNQIRYFSIKQLPNFVTYIIIIIIIIIIIKITKNSGKQLITDSGRSTGFKI